MPAKLRFAMVGAGNMGGLHARHIVGSGRAKIVAVCDPNTRAAKRLAAEVGAAAVFAAPESLYGNRRMFDAAVVCTPNITHAPICVALLEAGKSVYCEKPPAVDAAAAESVRDAARRAKGLFMVGFNQRFDPWAQYVKRQIEAGRLGKIFHIQTQWHRRCETSLFGAWFTNKDLAGGGPMMDIGVHRLDQALWLLDFPEVISVSGLSDERLARTESRRIGQPCTVEDFAAGLIRLQGGLTLIVQASYVSYLPLDAPRQSTLLMGTRCGYLEANGLLRVMTNGPAGPTDRIIQQFDVPPVSPMDHFLDCIARGRRPICTADQAYTVMRIIDAVYDSARTGREVRFDA